MLALHLDLLISQWLSHGIGHIPVPTSVGKVETVITCREKEEAELLGSQLWPAAAVCVLEKSQDVGIKFQ